MQRAWGGVRERGSCVKAPLSGSFLDQTAGFFLARRAASSAALTVGSLFLTLSQCGHSKKADGTCDGSHRSVKAKA